MKGYSSLEVLDQRAQELWQKTTELVEGLPEDPEFDVRCHELARAVAIYFRNHPLFPTVVDGLYGHVDHSWLVLAGHQKLVLDVYSVGSLPMVQLIDMRRHSLVYSRQYTPMVGREDIDVDSVSRILKGLETAPNCPR